MEIVVERVESLRFADGSPVRAASAIARLGDGWLIAEDDSTIAGWLRDGTATAVRVLPSVQGLDFFEEASGTKHLKPDIEAACELTVHGEPAVLLLGSGSSPARMRSSLVSLVDGEPRAAAADLSPLYARVAKVLEVAPDLLNLEGACVVGDSLRWFQRGLPAAGLPTASVDLDLAGLRVAVAGGADAGSVEISNPCRYYLGEVSGIGLGVTDAVSLGGQSLLVSAAAEDTPNPREDGPVVGSALALLEGAEVKETTALPYVEARVCKVEGLSIRERTDSVLRLLATVDSDDPRTPSLAVHLRVEL